MTKGRANELEREIRRVERKLEERVRAAEARADAASERADKLLSLLQSAMRPTREARARG